MDGPRFDALRRCVVEVLQVSDDEVVPEARLGDDLHGDSLDLVELGMVVEERFDVELSEDDLSCIITVAHAYEVLSAKLDG